jgi:hypothetical protein
MLVPRKMERDPLRTPAATVPQTTCERSDMEEQVILVCGHPAFWAPAQL